MIPASIGGGQQNSLSGGVMMITFWEDSKYER